MQTSTEDNSVLAYVNAHKHILTDSIPDELLSAYHHRETNDKGQTPLILAAMSGHMLYVKQLLRYDAGAVDIDDKTAYDHAVELGYTDVAEILAPIETYY